MSDEKERAETLRRLAVEKHGTVRAELEQRRGEPPRPGDLYVVEATAEQPVEWLVVDGEGDRRNVVPVDTQPLAGTADVTVADDDPGGPLVLRCGHGLEVDASLLLPEMRTGSVSEEALGRVRARSDVEPSTDQVETDADPEYSLWIEEVVVPARVALEAAAREAERPRLRLVDGENNEARSPSRGERPPFGRRRWAWAALVPLAVGLVWLLVDPAGRTQDPDTASLVLVSSTRGGGLPTLDLAPETERVELRVDLDGEQGYRSFRAVLTTLSGSELWLAADLREEAGQVLVTVPAERFPADGGELELGLEGVDAAGEVTAIGFYSFRIE